MRDAIEAPRRLLAAHLHVQAPRNARAPEYLDLYPKCNSARVCLQEEYLLEHTPGMFGCLRGANLALRWLLLHTAACNRRLRGAVAAASPPPEQLVALLLDTAELEFEVHPIP